MPKKLPPGEAVRGTPEHNTWLGMKQRCNYRGHKQYQWYGGSGITVCERWNKSFKAFLEDMGPRPDGMTLERIDSTKNYEPGNCKWATIKEQNRNRRSTIKVERAGRVLCIMDWCKELGLNVDRVYGKIRRGSEPKEAIEWALSF